MSVSIEVHEDMYGRAYYIKSDRVEDGEQITLTAILNNRELVGAVEPGAVVENFLNTIATGWNKEAPVGEQLKVIKHDKQGWLLVTLDTKPEDIW